jgi:hypothetical protein
LQGGPYRVLVIVIGRLERRFSVLARPREQAPWHFSQIGGFFSFSGYLAFKFLSMYVKKGAAAFLSFCECEKFKETGQT